MVGGDILSFFTAVVVGQFDADVMQIRFADGEELRLDEHLLGGLAERRDDFLHFADVGQRVPHKQDVALREEVVRTAGGGFFKEGLEGGVKIRVGFLRTFESGLCCGGNTDTFRDVGDDALPQGDDLGHKLRTFSRFRKLGDPDDVFTDVEIDGQCV